MADINYSSLLGLALPVTGKLSGVWGDIANQQITQLIEDAIAGAATGDVTNSDWTLDVGSPGTANEARCAILIATGSPGVARSIIAPANSKTYFVVNKSSKAVTVKVSGGTGVSIAAGASATVSFDGADFVRGAGETYSGGTGLTLTGTTFSVDYGTTAGTAAQGNDARLSDARTPLAHTHGNVTNDGKIGSTANLVVVTGAGGALAAKAAGTVGQYLAYNGAWATPPNDNTTYAAGTGLGLTGTTFSVAYGSTAGTAAQGNDSRITGALQTSAAGPFATAAVTVSASNPTGGANGDVWLVV